MDGWLDGFMYPDKTQKTCHTKALCFVKYFESFEVLFLGGFDVVPPLVHKGFS